MFTGIHSIIKLSERTWNWKSMECCGPTIHLFSKRDISIHNTQCYFWKIHDGRCWHVHFWVLVANMATNFWILVTSTVNLGPLATVSGAISCLSKACNLQCYKLISWFSETASFNIKKLLLCAQCIQGKCVQCAKEFNFSACPWASLK